MARRDLGSVAAPILGEGHWLADDALATYPNGHLFTWWIQVKRVFEVDRDGVTV